MNGMEKCSYLYLYTYIQYNENEIQLLFVLFFILAFYLLFKGRREKLMEISLLYMLE